MKRRYLLFALADAGMAFLASHDRVEAFTKELDAIELPADFQYPNGIASAALRDCDGTLYVGSITSCCA